MNGRFGLVSSKIMTKKRPNILRRRGAKKDCIEIRLLDIEGVSIMNGEADISELETVSTETPLLEETQDIICMNEKADTIESDIEEVIEEEQGFDTDELWIPNCSDDSDIEVIISKYPADMIVENVENKLEDIPQILEQNTALPTLSSYMDIKNKPPDIKKDIITVNLSDSSDDESNSTNTTNATIDKNISSISEPPHEEIKIDLKPDDDDTSQESDVKMELRLESDESDESDEESDMLDLSNLSANNVLKPVETDKLINNAIVSNVNTKDKTFMVVTASSADIDDKTIYVCELENSKNIPSTDTDDISVVEVKPFTDYECDPINVKIVGKTFLSSKDTETLNSLVMLKCTNCHNLEQCPKERPPKECKKCQLKLQPQCKKCTSGFISLSLLYTHLMRFHSQSSQDIQNLRIKVHYVRRVIERKPKNKEPSEPNHMQCLKCGVHYRLNANLEKHRRICTMVPSLNCKYCPVMMCFKKDLREHMVNDHLPLFKIENIESILDEIVQDGVNKLREQSKELTESGVSDMMDTLMVAYCASCDKKTYLRQQRQHHNRQHQEHPTRCDNCNEALIYACGDLKCPQYYPTAGELTAHVWLQHLSKMAPYHCTLCGYVTTNHKDLKSHRRICAAHEDLLPERLICPICNKDFKRGRYFKVHLRACGRPLVPKPTDGQVPKPVQRAHPPQPPQATYPCPVCGRIFKQERYFRAHVANCEARPSPATLPDQELVCEDCNKSFKQERWYKAHKSLYCDKLRVLLTCAHCRYKSFDKSRLRVHLRCAHIDVYTGRLLRCAKCGLKWTSIYQLNRHLGDCTGVLEIERIKMKRKRKKPGNVPKWDVSARFPYIAIELV